MRINFYIVDPGGNPTAIVRGVFTKKEKENIARIILIRNKFVEQVGFWSEGNNVSDATLEMAGGELCVNALRALAFLVAREQKLRIVKIQTPLIRKPVMLNVAGKKVSVTLSRNLIRVRGSQVSLPGIIHTCIDRSSLTDSPEDLLKQKKNNKVPASGVIVYSEIKRGLLSIDPYVRVEKLDTCFHESACGSGSIALACLYAAKFSIQRCVIIQPSRSKYDVVVDQDSVTLSATVRSVLEKYVTV